MILVFPECPGDNMNDYIKQLEMANEALQKKVETLEDNVIKQYDELKRLRRETVRIVNHTKTQWNVNIGKINLFTITLTIFPEDEGRISYSVYSSLERGPSLFDGKTIEDCHKFIILHLFDVVHKKW